MEVLNIKVNKGRSLFTNDDKNHLEQFKSLSSDDIAWFTKRYDIPFKFEHAIEYEKVKFFITKHWQVISNNSNEDKIMNTFEYVVSVINKNRNQKLSDYDSENMTTHLQELGILKEKGLTKYHKIMISLGVIGFIAGTILEILGLQN